MKSSTTPVTAYPIAQEIATSIMPHFVRHVIAAGRGEASAHLPQEETIAAIVDAAFWASLRREEGFVPKISLAFVPPDRTSHPLLFAQALPLEPEALARLGPAVEQAGIHLGLWGEAEQLSVWGTTRSLPPYSFVLEVVAPGVLVLKHSPGEDSSKFGNVAVLEGDKIKILALHPEGAHNGSTHMRSLLQMTSIGDPGTAANVLPQLAIAMRGHGHGGTLLVVPNDSAEWRESIRSIAYLLEPFAELTELIRNDGGGASRWRWQKNLRQSIQAIAELTAVDGATVMAQDYRVFAFGAKIRRRGNAPMIERVLLSEPVQGAVAEVIDPAQLGGTRHVSAAQFVHDQRDAYALVASQDGRFTLLAWSHPNRIVEAHRIEALLL
jgi:Probable sensor domain DACNV